MKGPGGRGRHSVRRTWQCPRCHKRSVTGGHVTQVLCSCTTDAAQPAWMSLTAEPRPRKFGLAPILEEEMRAEPPAAPPLPE